jgi:menaquinone-dependent protoporphyrinogen oxidase
MPKVQVVYATRHGGTAGIAERIAEVLRTEGNDVVVAKAADRPDPSAFDAHVIGSGVYIGSWLKEGTEFLERNQSTLATRPVWLFSSGPLPGSSKATDAKDPLALALGPEEGPGSGGRKKIAALSAAIQPRDHRVFLGAFNPDDPPKSMQERLVRLMPTSKQILPVGDFREWDAIEAWAREIAAELVARVPVG